VNLARSRGRRQRVARVADFSVSVKRKLAHFAGYRCSFPGCGAPTVGPSEDGTKPVNLGIAAHITAASKEGPRFDPEMGSEERKSASNGIWMCDRHGRYIDADTSRHTEGMLRRWKADAEDAARLGLETGVAQPSAPMALMMPWLDPSDSVLSFTSDAVIRVGREPELRDLRAFLDDDARFSWWVWTGPAGMGKSRLALELCESSSDRWHAGFLREPNQNDLDHLQPLHPTLVVVDYAAQRAEWLRDAIYEQAQQANGAKVRVLVLERSVDGSWWGTLNRFERFSESAAIGQSSYDQPREIQGLAAAEQRALIRAVLAHLRPEPVASIEVEDIAGYALRLDPASTPLASFIAGITWLESDGGTSVGRDEALRRLVLRDVTRLTQGLEGEAVGRAKRLYLSATTVEGLTLAQFASLSEDIHHQAGLLPALYELPEAVTAAALDGLRPDLLGELFVLDELAAGPLAADSVKHLIAANAATNSEAYAAFVERAASDHHNHPQLKALLDAFPIDGTWAALAVRIIPLLRSDDHPLLAHILDRLATYAQTGDPQAQDCYARARFGAANLLLFAGQYELAQQAYTTVLDLTTPDAAVYANLLNNRGITWLSLDRADLAMADFTRVINSPAAADEARACALNNRADLLQTDDVNAAIADRTALLELRNTSPDRRYIALVRRAREHWANGNPGECLHDLQTLLDTPDIATEQKMEARYERAGILKQAGRIADAIEDLEQIITAPRNFPNVDKAAQRELDELRAILKG
jgi:tetratricopeptide (TPR) repeat protein